jgi:hypothetical protein
VATEPSACTAPNRTGNGRVPKTLRLQILFSTSTVVSPPRLAKAVKTALISSAGRVAKSLDSIWASNAGTLARLP